MDINYFFILYADLEENEDGTKIESLTDQPLRQELQESLTYYAP